MVRPVSHVLMHEPKARPVFTALSTQDKLMYLTEGEGCSVPADWRSDQKKRAAAKMSESLCSALRTWEEYECFIASICPKKSGLLAKNPGGGIYLIIKETRCSCGIRTHAKRLRANRIKISPKEHCQHKSIRSPYSRLIARKGPHLV